MFQGKPIIGIVGGIGSGKSFVADLFGQLGCVVINSDQLVRQIYQMPEIKAVLRQWWGDAVLAPDGSADRQAIAAKVFADPEARGRLEGLIHPKVAEQRDATMRGRAPDPSVQAFVWDTPLLFETGLDRSCDAVVFVDAPIELRQQRVARHRCWQAQELIQREKAQMALDKKRSMAQYIVDNTADAAFARRQVEAVLSRILSSR